MYNIYSEKKNQIIKFINNDFLIKSLLLIGKEGVGKKIVAFNIAKEYLNLQNIIELFYNKNFIFLSKNIPKKEINFLYNYIKNFNINEKEKSDIIIIIYLKLIFQILLIISQFIYNINQTKKEIKIKDLEILSNYFYSLKNIYKEFYNSYINKSNIDLIKYKDYLIKLVQHVLDISDNLKTDFIYMKEILDIQSWIENSAYGEKKVIIVENADKMNIEVENAFLKTLEEPKEGVIFILTTNSKEKLLPTVLSRCVKFNIDKIEENEFKLIIQNEWGKSFLNYLNYYIKDFDRFFDILNNEDKKKKFYEKSRRFLNIFLKDNFNFYEIFEILNDSDISENIFDFLNELIIYILQLFENFEVLKNDIIDKNISKDNIKNILIFLEKLNYFSKDLNFSIEDGLYYLILNKELILNGEFYEFKFILW